MNKQTSSVSGGKWASLSPDYAKVKRKAGRGSTANLEFSGNLKNSLKHELVGDRMVRIIFDEQGKADGHNNFTGKSKLPLRQSIPKEDESFRDGIVTGIESIVIGLTEKKEDKGKK